jgi:hypothetical protein
MEEREPGKDDAAAPGAVALRGWGRAVSRCREWAWLPASLAFVLLAYAGAWQRGSHLDDYQLQDLARDVVTGERWPLWSVQRIPTFPVRTLNWVVAGSYAALLPHHEGWARGLAALNLALNAALLSWLIYRVLHARLAALIGGWLYLAPFCAYEALLWASAYGYLVATALALGSLHLFLSWMLAGRGAPWLVVLGAAALVCSLFIIEQPVVLLVLLPGLVFGALVSGKPADLWRPVRRCVLLCLAVAGGVALVWLLVYHEGVYQIANRGGFARSTEEVRERCRDFLRSLEGMTLAEWGRGVAVDAFWMGLRHELASPRMCVLLAATGGALVLVSVTWRRRSAREVVPLGVGLVLLVNVLLGFLLALWLPGVFIRYQCVEYRMLYVPSALAAAGVATLCWLLVRVLSKLRALPTLENMFVALFGVITWFCATCVLGYGLGFAQRYKLDQQELAGVRETLTAAPLPPDAWIISFDDSELTLSTRPRVSLLMAGVLETPWSAAPELARILRRRDFRVVTNYRKLGLRFVPAGSLGEGGGPGLWINETVVPTNQAVMITYRDGRAYVVTELTVRGSGGRDRVFVFPVAEELARHGAPYLRASVEAEVPQFQLCVESP